MYFNHDVVNYAMLNMMGTCDKNFVFFPENEKTEFESTIKGMMGEFTEAQQIPEDKLTIIRDAAKNVINKMTDRLVETQAKKSPAFKARFKPTQHLIMATERLYAQTMAFLGCPDIPYMFGSEMHNEIKTAPKSLRGRTTLKILQPALPTTHSAERTQAFSENPI